MSQQQFPHTLHYCNINSLTNKQNQIPQILGSFTSTAILALSEVKLDRELYSTKPLKRFCGYENHPFLHTSKSSGIVAMSHPQVPCRQVGHFNRHGNMVAFLQVSIASSLTLLLALVYVKPNCSVSVFEAVLEAIRESMENSDHPVLVLGDFNARHYSLGDRSAPHSSKGNSLVQWCDEHAITNLNARDCWRKGTRDNSVLDLALTNSPHLFSLRIGLLPFLSDHLSLSITVDAEHPIPIPSPLPPRWLTRKANWELYHNATQRNFSQLRHHLSRHLQSLASEDCDRQATMDTAATLIEAAISASAIEAVPVRKDRKIKLSPTEVKLARLLASTHRLHERYRRLKRRVAEDEKSGNTSVGAVRRKALRDSLKSSFLSASLQHKVRSSSLRMRSWLRLCNRIQGEKSPSVRWQFFRRTIASGRRAMNSITLNESDDVPPSLTASMNNFASFYSGVMSDGPTPRWEEDSDDEEEAEEKEHFPGLRASVNLTATCTDIPTMRSPLDAAFVPDQVRAAARCLRASTAPGPDNIHAQFLSKASPIAFECITNMFNASWQYSVVPRQWKDANAFGIFKKGNISNPGSYRLISVTSVVARTLERLVNDKLSEHLEANSFFSRRQAGFRKGLSTYDNIYQLLRVVYDALSKRKRLPVLFLDIVKAFDRVSHSHLLYKLFMQAKVTGKAWAWLRSFLTDRRFRVTSGRCASDWYDATAGVPQGCVLSPLLFAIFINDMDEDTLRVLLSLFADDGVAWPVLQPRMQYRTQMRLMREFGDRMTKWSRQWRLQFSTSKTQLVIFHNRRDDPPDTRPIRICGSDISSVDSQRYLGLIFDHNGKWNSQFQALSAKARATAALISRTLHRDSGPTPLATLTLVNALLLSQIRYAFPFWRPTRAQYERLLQIIALPLRRALGLPGTASARRTLWEYGLPPPHLLRLKSLVQCLGRAYRSANQGNYLPGLLRDDIVAVMNGAVAPASSRPSPHYCRPFATEAVADLTQLPAPPTLPASSADINALINGAMTTDWQSTNRVKHRDKLLKPSPELPLYLTLDQKPALTIRARLRLGVCLVPQRRHIYNPANSPSCPYCVGIVGTVTHMLLECPRFAAPRTLLTDTLRTRLRVPISLTLQLLKGLPPPESAGLLPKIGAAVHERCLAHTGDFLIAVNSIFKL